MSTHVCRSPPSLYLSLSHHLPVRLPVCKTQEVALPVDQRELVQLSIILHMCIFTKSEQRGGP